MSRFVLSILFFFVFGLSKAQDHCTIDGDHCFNSGEKITYNVGYYLSPLWISAGEVSFAVNDTVVNDSAVYHFDARGRTFKAYDLFFKVRDQYQSFVYQENLKPFHFIRDVHEGGTEIYRDVIFDYDSLTAQTDTIVTSITDCTFDVLSAVYQCRHFDFSNYKINDTIPLTMYLDYEVHHLYIRYLGKEEIKTGLGKFRAIKFSPLLVAGTLFEEGEGMTVWVTDDENKIPLVVESPILVGSVKARIENAEGVKYPFSSKIE